MELISLVRSDIDAYFEQSRELCFNERDLQMHLAVWLRESDCEYDDVDIEYYVPQTLLGGNYLWKNELRLDIVVRKGAEYLPVELKYKTRRVDRSMSRFGEYVPNEVMVMKNQGAQDLGMYGFWKDVRRLELVADRFQSVVGGLALFVTNDASYTRAPRATSNNYCFGMAEGWHETRKAWADPTSKCAECNPDFDVRDRYEIRWKRSEVDGVLLYRTAVSINKI